MKTFTKIVIAAALSMTATSSFGAERMGKCISHDGNVFDCIIAVPDHQAKAKRILGGGYADETARTHTGGGSGPSTPSAPGGIVADVGIDFGDIGPIDPGFDFGPGIPGL